MNRVSCGVKQTHLSYTTCSSFALSSGSLRNPILNERAHAAQWVPAIFLINLARATTATNPSLILILFATIKQSRTFIRQVSITTVTSSMVMEVSATFVANTTLREPRLQSHVQGEEQRIVRSKNLSLPQGR